MHCSLQFAGHQVLQSIMQGIKCHRAGTYPRPYGVSVPFQSTVLTHAHGDASDMDVHDARSMHCSLQFAGHQVLQSIMQGIKCRRAGTYPRPYGVSVPFQSTVLTHAHGDASDMDVHDAHSLHCSLQFAGHQVLQSIMQGIKCRRAGTCPRPHGVSVPVQSTVLTHAHGDAGDMDVHDARNMHYRAALKGRGDSPSGPLPCGHPIT